MFKTILLLSTVFLLGGCTDAKKIASVSRKLSEYCKSSMSVTIHFGEWGSSIEVQCTDIDLSFFEEKKVEN